MRSRLVGLLGCALVLLGSAAGANAGPRKVLVLPLDGNADASLRAKLNVSVQTLARSIEGDVSFGDTTFDETAAAVGCIPTAPACAEAVRTTLGVDELVYGSLVTSGGETQVIVRRVKAKQPSRAARTTIAADDAPGSAEAALIPLFAPRSAGPVADPAPRTRHRADPTHGRQRGIAPKLLRDPPPPVASAEPPYDNSKRTNGVILASAGGLSLVVGLLLWSSKASVQDDIDAAPTSDANDFEHLEELESRALTYAVAGNIMVLAGATVVGYGAWILYQDRQERRVVVAPHATPTTAGVMIGGSW